MTIKQEVIERLKESNPAKAKLCVQLNKHFSSIDRWIKENAENGPLTTASALDVIRELTGLTDKQILETSKATA